MFFFVILQRKSKNKMRFYTKENKLFEMICSDFQLLNIISRFGLNLGFEEKTIAEVCDENSIDCNTFFGNNQLHKERWREYLAPQRDFSSNSLRLFKAIPHLLFRLSSPLHKKKTHRGYWSITSK
jgi:DNA-binding transcriptional MerR regulator